MQAVPSIAHSREIRWFLQGEPPAALGSWFASSSKALEAPLRIDEYVHLPGCVTTGIKLREGRLEVKAQTEPPTAVSYSASVAGLRDGWVKWSRTATDAAALRELASDPADTWVYVAKQRQLRKFVRGPDGYTEISPVELPAHGYQVELTAVRARLGAAARHAPSAALLDGAPRWWSVCVEAFGDGPAGDIDDAVRALLGLGFPASLPPAASCAYPAWLARIAAD